MFLSQVGEPMMITVSEASDVTAFKSYAAPLVTAAASPAPASPPPTKVIPAAVSAPAVVATPAAATAATATPSAVGRVFVSPLASKLAAEKGLDVSTLFPGSGPKGRVIAADVATANVSVPQAKAAVTATEVSAVSKVPTETAGLSEGDFVPSPAASAISALLTTSKQVRYRF